MTLNSGLPGGIKGGIKGHEGVRSINWSRWEVISRYPTQTLHFMLLTPLPHTACVTLRLAPLGFDVRLPNLLYDLTVAGRNGSDAGDEKCLFQAIQTRQPNDRRHTQSATSPIRQRNIRPGSRCCGAHGGNDGVNTITPQYQNRSFLGARSVGEADFGDPELTGVDSHRTALRLPPRNCSETRNDRATLRLSCRQPKA